jgi:type IV pilus assembly protein PilO
MAIKIPEDMRSNQKQLMLLFALVALTAAILYVNFILIPQVSGVAGSLMKMSGAQARLNGAQADAARIQALRDSMASVSEKVELYEKMLPAEKEIPSLLENLSAMAKSSGVKIVGITPVSLQEESRVKKQVYKEIPIQISAKSGFHELGAFLSNLEGADRFMKVSDIQIKSNSSSPKKHDVELMVLTYVLAKG